MSHHISDNINSFNNTNSFNNVWNNCSVADEKSEILAWLSPPEPRDATRTFEPAGSMKWETGSYILRNIGIGLVVSVERNVIVQLCFATEVRGWARHTLGKKRHIKNRKGVADRLRS